MKKYWLNCFFILAFPVILRAQMPDARKDFIEDSLLQVAREQTGQIRKSNAFLEFTDAKGKPLVGLTVEVRHKVHDFRFASQMRPQYFYPEYIKDPGRMTRPFEKIFNYVTFNPFYWGRWEPQRGQTDSSIYGRPLEWATENNIPIKGHTLAWPYRPLTPKWVFDLPADSVEVLLLQRIEDITREFRGTIDEWDVVNEPLHPGPWEDVLDTSLANPMMPMTLETVQYLADYVEKCHWAAHKGNPDGTFVLNEYQHYSRRDIEMLFYALVRELQQRKVPLHAIGLQTHEPPHGWHDPRVIWNTWNMYSDLDLPIHITEVHVQAAGDSIAGGWREGIWDEEAQSRYCELLLRMAFAHPSVEAFVWWGLSDAHIWREGAGLIDKNYRPKPVYEMVDRLVNGEWKTNLDLETGNDGCVLFRGFHGTYDIRILEGKKELGKYSIHLQGNGENTWSFSLE